MERAKALRKAQTDAEQRLWSRLRANQLGAKFRRQHPLDGCIADFVCLEHRLIVELDGSHHFDQHAHDAKRTHSLESLGFRVLRFWNNDALERTDDVLEAIVAALAESPPPHPNPLPRLRRGRGSEASREPSTRQATENSPLPQAQLGGEGWVRGRGPQIAGTHADKSASDEVANARVSALHLRARLYALIRDFFAARNVLEVETPILSKAGNTEPNIESFTATFIGHVDAGSRERWLRTSPEHAMKRLLAAGVGDCYELGRVFRNGESGRRHNPEFTMLEWYRVGWDHRRLMVETCELVRAALQLVGRSASVVERTYRELFVDELGVDPFTAGIEALQVPLAEFRIDATGLGRDDWLDLLITHRIQPAFPHDRITLIHDFPATQCALAKIRDGDLPVAERFELYLGSHELANGYHELTDATEQCARFERDNARRRERGQHEMPIDGRLLAALPDMPACAGVALGVERLLMSLAGTDDIRGVLAFPFASA